MRNLSKFSTLFLALIALATTAPANAGVGLLGGVSFHNVTTDSGILNSAVSHNSKMGFVGGLAFSTNFLVANLEIDALYNHRTLEVAGITGSSPAIEVPILARFSLLPAILDLGVGPYGAFNVGSNDLGYHSPDLGLVGSLRVKVPTPVIHFVVDGRYNFGLTDLSDVPLVDVHTREVKVMLGIDVPFGNSDETNNNNQ